LSKGHLDRGLSNHSDGQVSNCF